MFLRNKYRRWYKDIIFKARQEIDVRELDYNEKHHIIPKCMGGSSKPYNMVKLTAKEHFICHLLLVKMTESIDRRNMLFALKCMSEFSNKKQKRKRYTSNTYNYFRPKIAKAISELNKGSIRIFSEEHKKKIGDSNRNQNSIRRATAARKNGLKGAEANRGKSRPEHLKQQWSMKRKGQIFDPLHKEKLKKAANFRSKIRCSCLFCKKEMSKNGIGSHRRFCKPYKEAKEAVSFSVIHSITNY